MSLVAQWKRIRLLIWGFRVRVSAGEMLFAFFTGFLRVFHKIIFKKRAKTYKEKDLNMGLFIIYKFTYDPNNEEKRNLE